jgi:hypothetical protein
MPAYCIHCGKYGAVRFCPDCGRPQEGVQPRADVDFTKVQETQDVAEEEIIFEGSTWPLGLLSPFVCRSIAWRINTKTVEVEGGCCHGEADSFTFNEVKVFHIFLSQSVREH